MGSALGLGKFSDKAQTIPYKKVKGIKSCPYMLLPMGTAIEYEDPDTGALATEKIYFGPGGGKWKKLMAEKAGISL